jgi:hypothetical protein
MVRIVSEGGRKMIGTTASCLVTPGIRVPTGIVSFSDPASARWSAHRSIDRTTPGGQT